MSKTTSLPRHFPDPSLYHQVTQEGQAHVFRYWSALAPAERRALEDQLRGMDFAMLREAIAGWRGSLLPCGPARWVPAQAHRLAGADREEAKSLGEELLRAGAACALTLAGGQGTRLGHPLPKGMYPAAPVTGKSFFAWFAEKARFVNRRYGVSLPWLVMTSPATHAETVAFFAGQEYFGLGREDVLIFQQGMLPCFDLEGRLMLDAPWRVCESPDGHGGVVKALARGDLLERLAARGTRHIFIHNIDNALVNVLDPAFLGFHAGGGCDFSLKALPKIAPDETLGAVVREDGRLRVVEYSDLPPNLAGLRGPDGELAYRWGSINISLIRLELIERLRQAGQSLPYHYVTRKIPSLNAAGTLETPSAPNGVKLETKLFDALAFTGRSGALAAERGEEFSPLKNPHGPESPETVRRDLRALYLSWLREAGVEIAPGDVEAVEISPLFAADRESFIEAARALGRDTLARQVAEQVRASRQISLESPVGACARSIPRRSGPAHPPAR